MQSHCQHHFFSPVNMPKKRDNYLILVTIALILGSTVCSYEAPSLGVLLERAAVLLQRFIKLLPAGFGRKEEVKGFYVPPRRAQHPADWRHIIYCKCC